MGLAAGMRARPGGLVGTSDRNIDHIHVDIGVGVAAVPVGAGLAVGLRLLQILFLHDFLALDHVMSAVGAFVLALHASGATAGM